MRVLRTGLFARTLLSSSRTVCASTLDGACGSSMGPKSIETVFPVQRAHWVGDGFNVYPVFGDKAFTNDVSPFLMFDYGAPKRFEPTTKRRGVGTHPHRGFETVTLALQGEIEHGDHIGNKDVIGGGGVQWMTAGRGIIHEEFHSTDFAQKGGVLEMCQLWVNLPKRDKMNPPKYQPYSCAEVPRSKFAGGYVRVIAGATGGIRGAATTHSPISLFHVVVDEADATVELASPAGHTALLFLCKGSASVAGTPLQVAQVIKMKKDGDTVVFTATKGTELILMGGQPLHEPIANHGPFVMNTQAELNQAFEDYHAGKF
ncbi:putative quercetin 2,3-dioxygenase [Pelagophyceae sp. CCMP2097]|nr:putative quercetin 2,3-dioxygenase [Pelagophyceae sp. CCMP2097]|mmetsp:Transcript_15339/g.51615  ORF Transcript_15339/g.51615 Transcript_15339/m.51615 type:complete len:316 (-) Transcript_15339:128-1075(-)